MIRMLTRRWLGHLPTVALTVALAAALPGRAADAPPDGVDAVRQRVARVEVLRGGFEQEKQVAGFKHPLRSQGRFVLARDRGVLWSTLEPFPSEMVVTRDRIFSFDSAGQRRVQLDATQQPALRQINTMMFALLDGDVAALAARFDIAAQPLPGNAWALTLTPKSALLAKAFARIELRGDRYVREVVLTEGGGDRTALKFVDLSETPARLSAEEASRLAP